MLNLLLKPWMASCHEARDRMSDYLEDDVSTRERTRIMRHLSRCERCRALLESLTRTLEQLRLLGDMETVPPTPATVRAVLDRIERERR